MVVVFDDFFLFIFFCCKPLLNYFYNHFHFATKQNEIIREKENRNLKQSIFFTSQKAYFEKK